MIGWIKKHSYWALALGVFLVAAIAVCAYAWNFRQLTISKDTANWADFATYLSGTVGVAAVVATLIAFVITLRQQKQLIDSQESMLNDHKRQIYLTEEKHKIEKAYQTAKDIFPLMVTNVKLSLQLPHYIIIHDSEADCFVHYSSDSMHDFFDMNDDLFYKIKKSIEGSSDDHKKVIIESFSGVGAIYNMISECFETSNDYVYFFDSWLAKDFGFDMPGIFYVECVSSFYQGLGEDKPEWLSKLIGYKRPVFLTSTYKKVLLWQQIGEMIKNKSV